MLLATVEGLLEGYLRPIYQHPMRQTLLKPMNLCIGLASTNSQRRIFDSRKRLKKLSRVVLRVDSPTFWMRGTQSGSIRIPKKRERREQVHMQAQAVLPRTPP